MANDLEGPSDAGAVDVVAAPVVAHTDLERFLLSLVDHAPSMIFLKDREYRYLFVNQTFVGYGHYTREQLIGRTDNDLLTAPAAAAIHAQEAQVIASGRGLEFEEAVPLGDVTRHFVSYKFPAYDGDGTLIGIGGIVTDVTERKHREAALLAEQQRVIDSQRDTLRELSTPLLPIADGVLALPLIGSLNPRRSQELLDTLLHGITAQRARIAILDVTGIRDMDVEVATALVTAARAARLVGAEVVLTGVSPAVAQTLVALGTDLTGIKTLATLASGIAFALDR